MKRILILDDNAARHTALAQQYLGCDRVHCWNVAEALAALAGDRFDVAQLDHDLQDICAIRIGARTERTGADVADHIARMAPEKRPALVIVHSWNPHGAERMMATLLGAGVNARRISFGQIG